MNRSSWL